MKTTIIRSSAVALALAFGASLGADLIGVEPGHPLLVFNNQGTTTYDATTNLFTIDANPVAIQFAPGQPPRFVNPTGTPRDEMVFLQVIIDESGALVGGVDGDDFIVTGEVDADGDGIVDYAGVLISGEVIDFGFQDNGVASNHGTPSGHPRPKPALGGDGGDDDKMPGGKNAEPKGKGTGLGALLGTTDLYDFRIVPTGGLLLPLFGGSDLGAIVTSEMSSFNGSFLVDFSGEAKGDIGPIDPLPGACCLPDGSCDELLATDCLILGGTPFGSGTLCDDVVCIPVGACCFTDGTCDVLPQDACDAAGGTFQGGGTTCADVVCIPVGACCLPDGSCDVRPQDECDAAGGTFQGGGTTCADVVCIPVGACCSADGSCAVLPEDECDAIGGTFQGGGTTCADVTCVPVGACCLPDQSCAALAEGVCVAMGGQYQGDGTVCADIVCIFDEGACCLPDGTCDIRTEVDCLAANGSYLGDDTQCTPSALGEPGTYRLCNHPDGAVAGPFYGLRLDELFDVTAGQDIFTFDFEAPGADVRLDYDGSSIHIYGIAFGGRDVGPDYDPAWRSEILIDFTYPIVVPTPGDDDLLVTAPDGSATGTIVWLATGDVIAISNKSNAEGFSFRFGDEDDDQGHRDFPGFSGWGWFMYADGPPSVGTADWIFTAKNICEPPAPVGACCLPDTSCESFTEAGCVALGGTYFGDGSACADVVCSVPMLGACCFCEGTCEQLTEDACGLAGGTFLGTGTTCAVLGPFTVDFSFEDDFVTPLFNGQDISTGPEFGTLVAISALGNEHLGPAIFDSTSGGPNQGGPDPDLLVNLGNLLILQSKDNPAQSVPGFFDVPNDEAGGGTLVFDYLVPVAPASIVLVDICPGNQDAVVTLTDGEGRQRVYDVPNGWTKDINQSGANGYDTLDLTTLLPQPGEGGAVATASEDAGYDGSDVVKMTVFFTSSGAVDTLVLLVPACPSDPCITGACCLADGSCVELGEDDCVASGGTYAGDGTVCNSPSCAPAGLVLHVDFDEQTGNVAHDEVGGLAMTLTNGNGSLSWIDDSAGGTGVKFNQSASSGTARIAASTAGAAQSLRTALQATNAITVQAFFKQTDGSTNGARIVTYSSSTNVDDRNFSIIGDPDDDEFDNWTRLRTSSGVVSDGPDQAWEENDAVVVAFTYDAASDPKVRVFVDGTQIWTKSFSGDFSTWTDRMLIFGNEATNDRPFVGRLYDVKIWNVALTASQLEDEADALHGN